MNRYSACFPQCGSGVSVPSRSVTAVSSLPLGVLLALDAVVYRSLDLKARQTLHVRSQVKYLVSNDSMYIHPHIYFQSEWAPVKESQVA